jgi:hypothetical protein
MHKSRPDARRTFPRGEGDLDMKKFKNPIIAAAVLAGLGLIGSLMNSNQAVLQAAGGPTVTIDPAQLPLQVTGSTTVAGTVAATQSGAWNVGILGTPKVQLMLPANAFTIPPTPLSSAGGGDSNSTPDPSGTSYAITSVSVSNPTGAAGEVTISAFATSANLSNCGQVPVNGSIAPGPRLTVQANSTTSLTFPQPYVTAAVSGPHVCLGASSFNGGIGETWSVVGYRVLP